jgi:hypothetical protein
MHCGGGGEREIDRERERERDMRNEHTWRIMVGLMICFPHLKMMV